MSEGRFVVVEGIDGAGSTTLVNGLVNHLRAARRPVRMTREPSGGPLGSLVRQVLSRRLGIPSNYGPVPLGWATMALLFASDRLDHLDAEILPLLSDGITVICDRYDLSSLTYQAATASADSPEEVARAIEWIRELNRRARRPDLTIVVDVDPEVAARRRKERGLGREIYEEADLQVRLAAAYAKAEQLIPLDRIVHVDGNRDAAAALAAAIEELRKLDAR
jgi:dTMP kinase